MKYTALLLVAFSSLTWGQQTVKPTPAKAEPAKAELAKEVPMPEADADKFLLAMERDSHTSDLLRAAYGAWAQQPAIASLFADKDVEDKAVQTTADALIKKSGLDPTKYQIDADGAGKPPHPKFVLKPVEAKKEK
jgi:hypothetical protein